MARLAIDFDGTLIREDEDGNLMPVEGAAEAMQALRNEGHYLIIHTCRTTEAAEGGYLREELELIVEVLQTFGIPFDEVYAGEKLIADGYVDDRAVAFRGDWRETVSTVVQRFPRRRAQ